MNFELVIQRLCDAQVEFVVFGGWAAIFHGSADVTNNLDIRYSRDPENLRKMAGVLQPYDPRPREFPPDLPFVWDAATLANGAIPACARRQWRWTCLAGASPRWGFVLPELEGLLEAVTYQSTTDPSSSS